MNLSIPFVFFSFLSANSLASKMPGNCAIALHQAISYIKTSQIEGVNESYLQKKNVIASCEISASYYVVEFSRMPLRHDDSGIVFWISKKDFWIEEIYPFRGKSKKIARPNGTHAPSNEPKGITF